VVSMTDPHGRILAFLNRNRYFFIQIAPQLLIIGVCILLGVYPVMLINHRTQQCLVLVFIVHSLHVWAAIGGHPQLYSRG
jgi:hypothetical protein